MIVSIIVLLVVGSMVYEIYSPEEEIEPPDSIFVQYLAFCDNCESLQVSYDVPNVENQTSSKSIHTVETWEEQDPLYWDTGPPSYTHERMWKSEIFEFSTTDLWQISMSGFNPNRTLGEGHTSVEIRIFSNPVEDAESLLQRQNRADHACSDIYVEEFSCQWSRYMLIGDYYYDGLSDDKIEHCGERDIRRLLC